MDIKLEKMSAKTAEVQECILDVEEQITVLKTETTQTDDQQNDK